MNKELKTKNRYFCAILYEDDPNFNKYIYNIKKKFLEVTYIRHDKDIKEDTEEKEEIKKPHYHILFKVGENARYIKSVANDIEIEPNYLQGCNKKAMLMYLIHLNNPEKTQYSIDEVEGELKSELAELLFKRQPEDQKLAILMENIIKGNIKNTKQLMIFAIESGLNDLVRKYQYLLTNVVKENNNETYKFQGRSRETRKVQENENGN